MNRDLRNRWVEALRSGTYKQGKHRLKRVGQFPLDRNYCCLGVLCEVAGLEFEEDPYESLFNSKRSEYFFLKEEAGEARCSSFLPDAFRKEIGIGYLDQEKLVRMNDEENCSFEDIANWVEENL